jgi:preprotein translocase subunit SecG
VLQKFTVWLGSGFFGITLLLAILFSRASAGTTTIQRELLAEPGVPVEVESAPAIVTETDVVVEESPVTDNP